MIIRPYKQSDFKSVDRIYKKFHQQNFFIPDATNVVTSAIVENEGKFIAFGMVKLFAEAILVLDLNESKRNKTEAIQELMLEALAASKDRGLSQLHTFIQDEYFARMMKKHYNFQDCVGKALVLEL